MIVQAKIISINPEPKPTEEHPKAGTVYYTVQVGVYGTYQFELPYQDLDNRYVPSDLVPFDVEIVEKRFEIGFEPRLSFAGVWKGQQFFDGDIPYITKVTTELWIDGVNPPQGPFDPIFDWKPVGWEAWQFWGDKNYNPDPFEDGED